MICIRFYKRSRENVPENVKPHENFCFGNLSVNFQRVTFIRFYNINGQLLVNFCKPVFDRLWARRKII